MVLVYQQLLQKETHFPDTSRASIANYSSTTQQIAFPHMAPSIFVWEYDDGKGGSPEAAWRGEQRVSPQYDFKVKNKMEVA